MSLILKLDDAKAKSSSPDEVLRRVFPKWVLGREFTRDLYEAWRNQEIRICCKRDNLQGEEYWSDLGDYTMTWNWDYVTEDLADYAIILKEDFVEGEYPLCP